MAICIVTDLQQFTKQIMWFRPRFPLMRKIIRFNFIYDKLTVTRLYKDITIHVNLNYNYCMKCNRNIVNAVECKSCHGNVYRSCLLDEFDDAILVWFSWSNILKLMNTILCHDAERFIVFLWKPFFIIALTIQKAQNVP